MSDIFTKEDAAAINAALAELQGELIVATDDDELMAKPFEPGGALENVEFKPPPYSPEQLADLGNRIKEAAKKGMGGEVSSRVNMFLGKLIEYLPVLFGRPPV